VVLDAEVAVVLEQLLFVGDSPAREPVVDRALQLRQRFRIP
jgi:hypothetical protein